MCFWEEGAAGKRSRRKSGKDADGRRQRVGLNGTEGLFGTWQSICAISETNGTDRQRWAQMDKNSAKTGQGGQRFAGFTHWHPWSIFAEYWPICAWLCLSVPFVSEMAQMDCQVPKSPYKCSQRCQRISRVILWHPWLHRNWWNLSILTHLCQIKLICAICVWHLCHLRMTGVILLPTFAKYLCLFTLET